MIEYMFSFTVSQGFIHTEALMRDGEGGAAVAVLDLHATRPSSSLGRASHLS